MVGKVETSIDPYALLGNFNVFLRVHGPLSLGGNPLSLCFVSGLHGPLAWVKGAYSCALSALHGDVGGSWRGFGQPQWLGRSVERCMERVERSRVWTVGLARLGSAVKQRLPVLYSA